MRDMEDLTKNNFELAAEAAAQANAENPVIKFQSDLQKLISESPGLNYTQIVGVLELTKLEVTHQLFTGDFNTKA